MPWCYIFPSHLNCPVPRTNQQTHYLLGIHQKKILLEQKCARDLHKRCMGCFGSVVCAADAFQILCGIKSITPRTIHFTYQPQLQQKWRILLLMQLSWIWAFRCTLRQYVCGLKVVKKDVDYVYYKKMMVMRMMKVRVFNKISIHIKVNNGKCTKRTCMDVSKVRFMDLQFH